MSLFTLKLWLVRAFTVLEGRKWLLLGCLGALGLTDAQVQAFFPPNLSLSAFTKHREPLGELSHVNVLLSPRMLAMAAVQTAE